MNVGKKGRQNSDEGKDFEFKVTFRINEELIEFDVDERLQLPQIDVMTPQKACNLMAENAAIHARWNVLANNAAIEHDMARIDFEVWEKNQAKIYRSELSESVKKRITDKMVEEAVMTDPQYLKKFNEVLKKKRDAANIKSIAIGFGERGERLVNIVSLMKSEKPTSGVTSGSRSRNNYDNDDDDSDRKAFEDND